MQFENELTEKWRRLQLEQDRRIPRPKLGTILMQTAFVTRDQLDEAIKLQNQTREGRIGEWLLRLGFVEEHQITAALAQQYGLPLINLNSSDANTDAVRMIPGKVAKCSGLVPVGFDDHQTSLRVAVTAPVNFNSQEAIRRMVQKGIVAYIGDQSAIQKLLEQMYEPEDLDMSTVPTFSSLEDLVEVGNEVIATAINHRAQDIRAELVQDFFWMRLDFPSESHHHLFRYVAAPSQNPVLEHENEIAVAYGAGR
jgi:type IV pilus assembly protein PilB